MKRLIKTQWVVVKDMLQVVTGASRKGIPAKGYKTRYKAKELEQVHYRKKKENN